MWGLRKSGDSYNTVTLNVELSEPSEYFSVANNEITCKKSGYYIINVPSIYFDGVSGDVGNFVIGKYFTSTTKGVANVYPGYFSGSCLAKIEEGDVFNAKLSSTSVGSRIGYNTNISEAVKNVFFYFLKSLD